MSYSSEVLADSPLLYWRFNSGGTDDSGNSRNSTGGTAGSSVAGLLPSTSDLAVQFNGSSQYFQLNYGSWMNTSSISLEVWVKTTTTASSILASRDNVGRAWQLALSTTGKAQFVRVFDSAGATSVVVASSATSVNDGNTHHVVVTYDGTTCLIYVDGVLDSTTTISNGLYASGSSDLHVARYHTASNYYAGIEDELAWYGTVLSAGRIAAHYTAATTIPDATVVVPVATATASAAAPVVTATSTVSPPAATATASAPTPVVTGTGDATVVVPAATSTGAALAPSVSADATIAAPAADATASAPTPTVAGTSSATVTVPVATAGAGAIAPFVFNGSPDATIDVPVATAVASARTPGVGVGIGADVSNVFNGRSRSGSATAVLTVPVTATPAGTSRGTRVDKAVPLPLPTLVNGRPT